MTTNLTVMAFIASLMVLILCVALMVERVKLKRSRDHRLDAIDEAYGLIMEMDSCKTAIESIQHLYDEKRTTEGYALQLQRWEFDKISNRSERLIKVLGKIEKYSE